MKTKKKAFREKYARAVRENEEQLETIQNLLTELKLPSTIIHPSCPNPRKNAPVQKNGKNQLKIQKLEKVLADKIESFNNLKIQIEEYLNKAQEFEELLRENEREKEQILLSFQNTTDSRISNTSRLEAKISDLEQHLSAMNEERKQSQQKQNELRNELSNANQRITFLKSATKQFEDNDKRDLNEILRQKQSQVQMLREKLADAYKEIESKKKDAELLRNIMKSDESTI